MRNEVTIDGITLTRAQAEKALAEMNAPDIRRIKRDGTEAAKQVLDFGTIYWLPFDREEIDQFVRGVNVNKDKVAGVYIEDGRVKLCSFMFSNDKVINGKIDIYPVVKGKVAFIEDKE